MKTYEEKIEVMLHFLNGGEIEYYSYDTAKGWYPQESDDLDFTWETHDFRIKEKKQSVTIEKWLYKDGDSYFILDGNSNYHQGYAKSYNQVKLLDSYEVQI